MGAQCWAVCAAGEGHPGQQRSAEEAQSLPAHLGNFGLPQQGRWLVFAFIMNSRRQGLSKVKVLSWCYSRGGSSVPCEALIPVWFEPWQTMELSSVDALAQEVPGRCCQWNADQPHSISKGEALLWLHLSFSVGLRKMARLSQLTALILLTRRQTKPQPNIGSKYLINMVLFLNTSCLER